MTMRMEDDEDDDDDEDEDEDGRRWLMMKWVVKKGSFYLLSFFLPDDRIKGKIGMKDDL